MRKVFLAAGVIILLAAAATMAFTRPSNERIWEKGQQRLARATFRGDSVTITDLRDFAYKLNGEPVEHYDTRSYDLKKLQTVWFVLAPFESDNRGPAHTFLSFGFADSQYVAISVEARRELGEQYSLVLGMLRRFELMYVIGDERDLIGMRANIRNDDVYVYPIRTTPERARKLFVQMLQRANKLAEQPEFYNTLTNNCTTNILEHANAVSPKPIPYGKEVLLPGYADELAQRLGLIDSSLSLEQARTRYHVNDRARAWASAPDFSTRIRAAQ